MQVGLSQVSPAQVCPYEVGPSHVGCAQVCPSQVCPSQVGSSQVRCSQVGSEQIDNRAVLDDQARLIQELQNAPFTFAIQPWQHRVRAPFSQNAHLLATSSVAQRPIFVVQQSNHLIEVRWQRMLLGALHLEFSL